MWVFDVVVFLFSFLWVRCVLFKMRVVTNWGTKVLITPRDYRGDQRSEKKYFVMMRSLGPWEIAFLLLKSSRLRKWCIVWDVCRLKCVACTLKLSVVSILSPFYETKTHCFSNPEITLRLCDVNNSTMRLTKFAIFDTYDESPRTPSLQPATIC